MTPRLEELSTFILAAVELHEQSWDNERKRYRTSINAAIELTVGRQNEYTCRLMSILLHSAWNDAIDWAKEWRGQ